MNNYNALYPLKGSYDVAKKNIILCIWCNAMCLRSLRFKNTLFSTYCTLLLLLYAPPFWNTLILQSSSFWEARRALIGQLSSALWLAETPQAWDGNVTPLTVLWCHVQARRHKNNKTHYKKAFVASSGDIITDYNYLYCLFMRCSSRRIKHNTMSAFVIVETLNKRYSTLLKTHVWIASSKFFKYRKILTDCESEAPDCPCDVRIAPLYSVHITAIHSVTL